MLTTVLDAVYRGSLFGAAVLGSTTVLADTTPETPTTVLGALILIAVSATGVLGWIVKKQYDTIDAQNKRLETVAVTLHAVEQGLQNLAGWKEECAGMHKRVTQLLDAKP